MRNGFLVSLVLASCAAIALLPDRVTAQDTSTTVCGSTTLTSGSTFSDAAKLRQACALAKYACQAKLGSGDDAAQQVEQCVAGDMRQHFPNAERDVAAYEEAERERQAEERAQEEAQQDEQARTEAPVVQACAVGLPVYLIQERRTVRTVPDAHTAALGRCKYLWGSGRIVVSGTLPFSAFRAVMPGDPPPMGSNVIIRVYPPRF